MTAVDVFLWGSAALFWAVVACALYRGYRKRRGTNEKVRTEEKVVAVLKGAQKRTIS